MSLRKRTKRYASSPFALIQVGFCCEDVSLLGNGSTKIGSTYDMVSSSSARRIAGMTLMMPCGRDLVRLPSGGKIALG